MLEDHRCVGSSERGMLRQSLPEDSLVRGVRREVDVQGAQEIETVEID